VRGEGEVYIPWTGVSRESNLVLSATRKPVRKFVAKYWGSLLFLISSESLWGGKIQLLT
jgi:hypothetical protein